MSSGLEEEMSVRDRTSLNLVNIVIIPRQRAFTAEFKVKLWRRIIGLSFAEHVTFNLFYFPINYVFRFPTDKKITIACNMVMRGHIHKLCH